MIIINNKKDGMNKLFCAMSSMAQNAHHFGGGDAGTDEEKTQQRELIEFREIIEIKHVVLPIHDRIRKPR